MGSEALESDPDYLAMVQFLGDNPVLLVRLRLDASDDSVEAVFLRGAPDQDVLLRRFYDELVLPTFGAIAVSIDFAPK